MINLCLPSEFLGCRLKQISTLVEIINQTPLLTAESADSRAGSKWDVEIFLQGQAIRQWPLPPDTFTPNSLVPRTQTREKPRSRNELIYTGRAYFPPRMHKWKATSTCRKERKKPLRRDEREGSSSSCSSWCWRTLLPLRWRPCLSIPYFLFFSRSSLISSLTPHYP